METQNTPNPLASKERDEGFPQGFALSRPTHVDGMTNLRNAVAFVTRESRENDFPPFDKYLTDDSYSAGIAGVGEIRLLWPGTYHRDDAGEFATEATAQRLEESRIEALPRGDRLFRPVFFIRMSNGSAEAFHNFCLRAHQEGIEFGVGFHCMGGISESEFEEVRNETGLLPEVCV